jgi:hypothetical protein
MERKLNEVINLLREISKDQKNVLENVEMKAHRDNVANNNIEVGQKIENSNVIFMQNNSYKERIKAQEHVIITLLDLLVLKHK